MSKTFDNILEKIEPNEKAVKYAQKAHVPVREFLESEASIKDFVIGSFLYGSYKRHTAVGKIKDVDIVILTNFDITKEDNSPSKVLRKLKDSLAKFYKDPENPEYQRRSIRINDPLPDDKDTNMTLDIIPAVPVDQAIPDGVLWVPDRESKCWVKSNPNGHIAKTSYLNSEDVSSGKFVPLVKLMKAWWKYQCSVLLVDVERPKPKGFWVECLTAENFDSSLESMEEQFCSLLQNISNKYSHVTDVPTLKDPGLPYETIKTSMTLKEFQKFMDIVEASANKAIEALNENDQEISARKWNELFGLQTDKAQSVLSGKKALQKGDPGEHFLSEYNIPENISHRLRINAYVLQKGWSGKFELRDTKNPLRKEAALEFFIQSCDVEKPYEVKWKVKNYGTEAEDHTDLRGEITNDIGYKTKKENTKYTGRHYVECYIIRNNICVAKDRLEVPIANLY